MLRLTTPLVIHIDGDVVDVARLHGPRGAWDLDAADDDVTADLGNRCCRASVPAGWLREQIDAHRRRAVPLCVPAHP